MIKTFEQFINENYNEKDTFTIDEEYGAPLFNEVSESLISEIRNSINEGKIVIDVDMIEEGLFDVIGKLFKKGSDAMNQKIEDNASEIDTLKTAMGDRLDNLRLDGAGDDVEAWGKDINDLLKDEKLYQKIESLCKSAEDICAKLAEKEESVYKKISEKMTAVNEAIKEFTEKAIATIKEIVEMAKHKISAVIAVVILFCKKMAAFAANAIEKISQGIVLAFSLPFVLAFAVYKGALNVCEELVKQVKNGAEIVRETFVKIKDAIVAWVSDSLTKTKDILKKTCDAVKDSTKSAFTTVGKTFLTIVAVLGQLASDAKDAIKNAYDAFVNSVKDLSDEVKVYVSEKWNVVSGWCKKVATSFADGVKTIWGKMKEKVTSAIGDIKKLKDNIKEKNSKDDDKKEVTADPENHEEFAKEFAKAFGADMMGNFKKNMEYLFKRITDKTKEIKDKAQKEREAAAAKEQQESESNENK